MAELDRGSGGGGGTAGGDGTAEVTVSNLAGSWTFEITLPWYLRALRPLAPVANSLANLARHPTAWIVAALIPMSFLEAQARLAAGESPAELIIEDYLFRQLLVPAGAWLFNGAVGVVTTVLDAGIFLANIPLGAAGLSAQGLATGAGGIGAAIRAFNLSLVEPITALGVGAQPAATALGVGQIVLAAWLGWILVRSLDFPFLNPLGAILAFTRPFRNLFRGLFG